LFGRRIERERDLADKAALDDEVIKKVYALKDERKKLRG
jgi:hypothetical protein